MVWPVNRARAGGGTESKAPTLFTQPQELPGVPRWRSGVLASFTSSVRSWVPVSFGTRLTCTAHLHWGAVSGTLLAFSIPSAQYSGLNLVQEDPRSTPIPVSESP